MRHEFEYNGREARFLPERIRIMYGTVKDGEEKLAEEVIEKNKFGSFEMKFTLDEERMCFYLPKGYETQKICDENYLDITRDFVSAEANEETRYLFRHTNKLEGYKIYLFLS